MVRGPFGVTQLAFVQNQKLMMDRSSFLMSKNYFEKLEKGNFRTFMQIYDRVCFCNLCPGAEHASITMRTNMQVAQTQVDEARKLSADAERKLAETKVMEVERMSQYVTSLENNDEEEVPEAYLRED